MSSGSGSFGRAVPGYASEDPSLPKPWRGLVDGITGYLYYWNPDTNVMQFFRIGTIVLALHDTSDVFLETAKLCKYTEKELGASLFFGLFAISWLLLRLIYFPFWIIKASSYHSITFWRKLDEFPTALYYIFNTMLLTLLVFHMYWWKLICLMIMRQLNNKGQVTDDVRSDSEDDE
ncbi:hypothetical protein Zm00014a_018585 [Zea mays]|uniref:TLC domain-containing protein n=2 Tax=Zea mays TaxID=4577 RepID=A0A8J8YB22_MAIZE|nr:LAG1 longevity assurance homolog 2 [Zea mays]PWZ55066.1 hypothetical protein Zm00014a_018585 [Zea mays]